MLQESQSSSDLRTEARRALATRALPGLPVYIVAWLLLGAAVSFAWPRPSSLILGAVIAALSVARLALVLPVARGQAAHTDTWLRLFRADTLALGLSLGVQSALLVLAGLPDGGRDVVLAITAAVGSVAIFVFAPDLPLVVGFPLVLNAPLLLALLWRGGAVDMVLVAADLVFLGYSIIIGRRLNSDHWAAARSAQLLREHAAELEAARERLAQGSAELERRVEERTREAREREEEYRRIFESAHDAIVLFDPEDERVLAVNQSACHLYGLPAERFVGMSLKTLTRDPAKGESEVARTLEEGRYLGYETVHYRSDGSEMTLEINATVIPYQGRTAILSLNRDVTARATAHSALRESENRYRALFEASPLPLWVCDPETLAIRDANEAAVSHYGFSREEFRGMSLPSLQASADDLPEAAAEQEVTAVHRKKDGTRIRVEVVSRDLLLEGRLARLVLAHDVTVREHLEAQLRQARKMEAIGRLAGGIAHDFNNMLTAILGYGELLQGKIGGDPELARPLQEILVAGNRAATLTRQLLAFSRKQILAPRVVDLSTLVQNLTGMLERIIGEDIRLVTVRPPSPVRVKADPGQIEQVILNLVVNARDAMPHGGRLTIETAIGAEGAVLTIRDTGTGMDAETLQHLFEPFFTTKGVGKGTGLGLATVQGIVEQSGGRIEVRSKPGTGSEFEIHLPGVAPAPGPVQAAPVEAPPGRETILLVEDEQQVRLLAQSILELHGYSVIGASDGEEALRLFAARRDVDLLLTDVVLPGIGGTEVAARLRKERPGLRVLFMSGYAGPGARRSIEEHDEEYLAKPFHPAALLQKVRATLDAPAE